MTISELLERLPGERGVKVSRALVWTFIDRWGLTFLKDAHASEQDREDLKANREAWFDSQLDLDPERLVFIDETWMTTNLARKSGRAFRGERLRAGVHNSHWKTATFVAGLRLT